MSSADSSRATCESSRVDGQIFETGRGRDALVDVADAVEKGRTLIPERVRSCFIGGRLFLSIGLTLVTTQALVVLVLQHYHGLVDTLRRRKP